MPRLFPLAVVTAALAAMIAMAGIAAADSKSTDFETYALGNINGQNGWTKTGALDVAVSDPSGFANAAGFGFGTRSLRISNATTINDFASQTYAPLLTQAAGEGGLNYFEANLDIGSTLSGVQTGLAFSLSPSTPSGSRMSYLRFEDQADGIHVFFLDTTDPGPVGTSALFNETDIATISRTAAHSIQFRIWYFAGPANDIVHIYIDGNLEITGTTWEDYYRYDPEQAGGGNVVPDINTLIFRTAGTAAPATSGNGFLVDNLDYESADVVQCTTVCYVDDATGNDGFGGTSPADAKKTIQAAVDTVSPGGMVIVAAGAYTEDVSVNETVDIRGAQYGVGVGSRTWGDSSESTLEGVFRLGAPGISVDGFSIQHHVTIVDESAGINVAQAGSGASITHNMFAHIISSALDDAALAHAIFLNNGPDNVTITDNSIDDVSSQGSAKGILIGDSNASNASLNIDIERNKITNVLSTNKGAYGIQVNNNTGASPTIKFNRLDNFQGNWARAIALETTTPSGAVEFNVITNLTDQNSVLFPGQVAVYFEDNPTMANVGVHRNSLNVGTDSWGVAINPLGPGGPVDATCNWWGNFTGPGSIASGSGSKVTPNVTYSPWLQTSNLNGDCEANGNITIILQTHPEPKQFSFTGTNGIAPFTLLDDGTTANTKSFSVPAGLYVFRLAPQAKWALISLTCNLHETILKTHHLVQIQLQSDQNVVCTFTESLRKPDASIALASGGPYSGDNIYSSGVLASQTLSQPVAPGTTESFFVHLQNDGLDTDKFRLSSKLKGSLYYQVAFMSGTVEITGKVNAGTYRFKLAPGATKTIEIRVLAPLATPPGDTRSIVLTMQSRTAPAATDVVKAFVNLGP